MNHFRRYTLVLICVLLAFNSYSQIQRSVEQLSVLDKKGNQINIMQLLTQDHWVLIILNENLNISQKMLTQLQDKKVELKDTVILIIGNHQQPPIDEKYHQNLVVKAWVHSTDSNLLKSLKLAGTPVVLGMNTADIAWQISGFSTEYEINTIINRINSWSNK